MIVFKLIQVFFLCSDYRREFPADDYNHNNTSTQQTSIHQNDCIKNEIPDGVTTIIENIGNLTPVISHTNRTALKDNEIKSQLGSSLLDSTTKFSGNHRSSRNRVSDESQQYSNLPSNCVTLQGHHQSPLSVSVSASNSPFVNKRMGSKQTLLQVNISI